MKSVLVLGATGYIGSWLVAMLRDGGGMHVVGASSRAPLGDPNRIRLDTRDGAALTQALMGFDTVINCVAGDKDAIANGSRTLVDAAQAAGCKRIVHLSTMSVYGALEGLVDEAAAPGPLLGWYDQAKREAETHIAGFAAAGGTVVMLRPGCVWGPGCELWVGRVGRWLRARRLGDLGAAGDGWTNLVHVDDVCLAVLRSMQLQLQPGDTRIYNLAAPDSPRWNEYFVDLALAIEATPVKRLSPRQLALDAKVAGPVLHVLRKFLQRAGKDPRAVPDPVTPGLLGVWQRHLRMDPRVASRDLKLDWTPYAAALQECAAWFVEQESLRRVQAGAMTAG